MTLRPLIRFLIVLCLALCAGLADQSAFAQTSDEAASTATQAASDLDYEAWEEIAQSTENLISGGVASTSFFEARRADLVEWRALFLEAETENDERVATIQAQIDALGAAPEEGETESETIALRRADLQERLAEAQLPSLQANEAFTRADGLISEIDTLLAERQAQELLEIDPTPLNPVNWATALSSLVDLAAEIQANLAEDLEDPDIRSTLTEQALAIVAMVVVGLVLVLGGRPFVTRIGDRFLDVDKRRGRTALGFVVSLGQLLLPLLGFIIIVAALSFSGLLTDEVEVLIAGLLGLIFALYTALWLAGRLFPDHENRAAAFAVPLANRAGGRRILFLIGMFIGLANLAHETANLDIIPDAARGVLVVPFLVGLGLAYLRLARFLRRARADLGEADSSNYVLVVLGIVTIALRVIAIAGPILGLIGFINAGVSLMVPTGVTLFFLGLLVALQAVVRDIYALVMRTNQAAAAEALIPVLVNFVLLLLMTPVVAIAWGVRPERLGELYVSILEGVTVGDTRITPGVILAVILIFAAGLLVTRLLQGALKSTVLPRTRLDVGARNAVSSGVGYVGIALAAVIAVTTAGIDLTALGFVVGALSVGIGFGLQNVVSNFVSGIILLIERPISEGDWIEVNGSMGIVKDISVRSTTIETFDKTDVIVPNADFISGTVTNWTRGNTVGRAIVSVGVAYGSDTRRVSEILLEIGRGHPEVAAFPEPGVDFLGFGSDSLDFRLRCILRDINNLMSVKTELHHQIAERFAAEGIEIPFAQRDIWLRNPEALHAGPAGSKTSPDRSSE